MPSPKRRFGDAGELIAKNYLQQNGYEIIDQNFRKKYAEIDIIAKKNRKIFFVEVKTRDIRYRDNFLPEQSVNKEKMRKLKMICRIYLAEKHYGPDQEWQIDIISILINRETGNADITHMENAVWERQY